MHLTAMLNAELLPVLVYNLAVLAASMFVIAKSSEFVVANSMRIVRFTRMAEAVFGFIVLSVATNVPELALAFSSAISGNAPLSAGNIIGSNVAELTLVFGLSAIICPITLKRKIFQRLPLLLFISSLVPLSLLGMQWFDSAQRLGGIIGTALVLTFAFFVYYSVHRRIRIRFPKMPSNPRTILRRITKHFELYRAALVLCAGLLAVIVAASFIVSSAAAIAGIAEISESVIGATVIAFGTTLPELSVSLTAIRKRHKDLAVANIIGSCLTKVTLVFGMLMLLSPVFVDIAVFSTLLVFLIGITMAVWYFFTSGSRLDRKEGIVLVMVYVLFLISAFGVQLAIA